MVEESARAGYKFLRPTLVSAASAQSISRNGLSICEMTLARTRLPPGFNGFVSDNSRLIMADKVEAPMREISQR